jgi:hypothetical protein
MAARAGEQNNERVFDHSMMKGGDIHVVHETQSAELSGLTGDSIRRTEQADRKSRDRPGPFHGGCIRGRRVVTPESSHQRDLLTPGQDK